MVDWNKSRSENALELHRARIGFGTADTVSCITSDACGTGRVAIARQRGELEVHELSSITGVPWRLRIRIPGRDGAHCTSCAFVQSQLVTAGLEGTLLCWDGKTARPLSASDSLGGAAWCIAPSSIHDGLLAVACDDGCVRLFMLEKRDGIQSTTGNAQLNVPELVFTRCFPRALCRQLAICWVADPLSASERKDASLIVAGGSDGSIRLYDPSTATERKRVTISERTDECIWCVTPIGRTGAYATVADATSSVLVACGDSSGRLSVVDLSTGTIEHSECQHSADILSVQSLANGSRIFTSGADGMVAAYDRAERTEQSILSASDEVTASRWRFAACKRSHSHDVYALCCMESPYSSSSCQESLLSGGVDGHVLWYDARRFLKYHPKEVALQDRRCVATSSAPAEPIVAAPREREVHCYTLASAAYPSSSGKSEPLKDWQKLRTAKRAQHPATLQLGGKHFIWSCTISPSGGFIALSDCFETRVLSLEQSARPRALMFRTGPSRRLSASDTMLATVDPASDTVVCFDIESGSHMHRMDAHLKEAGGNSQYNASETEAMNLPDVKDVVLSPNSRWACVLAFDGADTAFVYSIDNNRGASLRGTLAPQRRQQQNTQAYATPCVATFSPASDEILVAFSDNQVHVYDAKSCKLSAWSERNKSKIPWRCLNMPGSIHHVSFNPDTVSHKNALVATPSAFCCINFGRDADEAATDLQENEQEQRQSSVAHKRKRGPAPPPKPQPSKAGSNFRVVPLDKRCMFMSYVSSGEALLIEHSWEDTAREKPPPVFRKRFGA